jgi:hypothetical protein
VDDKTRKTLLWAAAGAGAFFALRQYRTVSLRGKSVLITGGSRGDAEVILGLPAQLAVRFHGVFPGLTADILGLVNRLLPGSGGIGTGRAKGKESISSWSPSWLTALTEAAARRNNEMQPQEVRAPEAAQ